jgi:hypothetical protein
VNEWTKNGGKPLCFGTSFACEAPPGGTESATHQTDRTFAHVISFKGVLNDTEIDHVIAYLKSIGPLIR